MFEDWLKSLRGLTNRDPARPGTAGPRGKSSLAGGNQARRGTPIPPSTRHSNGLEQFFGALQGEKSGRSILDFSPLNQSNLAFITGLGHRLYSQDVLSAIDKHFPDGDQTNQEAAQEFLSSTFTFRDYDYDGALVWDTLQFLSPQLLQVVVERLYNTLRPNAPLLAYFHADEKSLEIPTYTYRIAGPQTLELTHRGYRTAAQPFNNRSLERIFNRFGYVKFFLTREALREVIVRR